MSVRRPPRREPRILAVRGGPHGLLWAVADPWEVRSVGTSGCRVRSRRLALLRLVCRERPTAVVPIDRRLAVLARSVAALAGVAALGPDAPVLPSDIARDLYPELRLWAPDPAHEEVARAAIAAVLHAPHHPRPYARRHPAARRAA